MEQKLNFIEQTEPDTTETRRNTKEIRQALFTAFPHTIPVLTGFLVLGMAYGMLMRTKGFGVEWAVLMSAVAFCGSMQFVAITLLTAAFDPIQAFFLSLLVNARHMFYGLSMMEKYKGLGKARALLIYVLCDETFSISSGVEPPKGVSRKYFYVFISLLDYAYWVAGTAIGGLIGSVLPFNTAGLDFVLTALFVVLFLEQMKKKENRAAGIIGVTGAILCLLLFGASNFIIPAMALICAGLLVRRKRACN
jgi:4-azaleucine resistance transporter AzlC